MIKKTVSDYKQYVSFYTGAELFGIDIRLVNEVNPNVNIVPIPLSASYILGYVNIRGQVVLVLDLAIMFGGTRSSLSEKSHIILFKTTQDFLRLRITDIDVDFGVFGDKPVAVLADVIGDVIGIQADQVETPTEHINDAYNEFMEGVARTGDDLLIILNPVKILSYRQEQAVN